MKPFWKETILDEIVFWMNVYLKISFHPIWMKTYLSFSSVDVVCEVRHVCSH